MPIAVLEASTSFAEVNQRQLDFKKQEKEHRQTMRWETGQESYQTNYAQQEHKHEHAEQYTQQWIWWSNARSHPSDTLICCSCYSQTHTHTHTLVTCHLSLVTCKVANVRHSAAGTATRSGKEQSTGPAQEIAAGQQDEATDQIASLRHSATPHDRTHTGEGKAKQPAEPR